jgi:hypothetical protein
MNYQVVVPGQSCEQQERIRHDYFERVGESLGGTPQEVGTSSDLGKVFMVDATDEYPYHLAIVTFGCSWNYGNELVIRFVPMSDDLETKEVIDTIHAVLMLLYFAQQNVVFKNAESCAIRYPLPWIYECDGIQGSLITEDTVLRGTHYDPTEYKVTEPLHTSYWPQHFLSLHFLYPDEYQFCQSVSLKEFISIVSIRDAHLINDFSRRNYLNNFCAPAESATESFDCCIAHALQELQSRSPSRLEVPGMKIDLRVRKYGNALDIVLVGASVQPLLNALHAAFAKPMVPRGTVVCACDTQNFIDFYCYDEDGNAVTPDTAKYVIHTVGVGNPEPHIILKLSTAEFRYFALMSPGHLWRGFYLGRVMRIAMFLPAAALGGLPFLFNAAVADRFCAQSSFDDDPLIVEVSPECTMMKGTNEQSGFPPEVKEGMYGVSSLQGPSNVRFIVAGNSYFNDSVFLNDNGEFMGKID